MLNSRLYQANPLKIHIFPEAKIIDVSPRKGDYVKTKRALIRAVEKQAEMSEKMDLLKAELEAVDREGGAGGSGSGGGIGGGGGFGAGFGGGLNSLRGRLTSATQAFSGSPAKTPTTTAPVTED